MRVSRAMVLLALAAGMEVAQAFSPRARLTSNRRAATLKSSTESSEAETEEQEIRKEAEMIAKRKRSNMYNENGVAYAPWMVNQIDEEAYLAAKELRKMRKKRDREASEAKIGAMVSSDVAADELAGSGLKYRFVGEEVELSWSTNTEPDNLGYKVQKRVARSEDWIDIASYEDWAPLASKGAAGGTYSFLDPNSEQGDWIYRIIDVDGSGRSTILCQALVEVQSAGERTLQLVLAGGFAAIFAGLVAAGTMIDPIQ